MTQNILTPSRRTVLRTAAWTAPAVSLAVASPAFASSNPPSNCVIVGTRNKATFTATITCGLDEIRSVQIGSSVATQVGNSPNYRATLTVDSSDLQTVTVVTSAGTITQSVTFVPA